jgi:hypothetical protein
MSGRGGCAVRKAAREFKRLSPAERVRWCEERLNRLAELEAEAEQYRHLPEYAENMRTFAKARCDITNVLNSLHGVPMPAEYLTLWGHLNRWVSDWAERDREREALRRRRCAACGGHGSVVGAGQWFETCRSCGGSGQSRYCN